jgi:Uma2 family endonuclease
VVSPAGPRDASTRSLDDYERESGGGYAFPDNVGFVVDLPGRRSFSPDAAFWTPVFAVEVRSENDYGPEAEIALARKRADYFAAGTQVVWDVLRDGEIRAYRPAFPQNPAVFRRGQRADAEPALPGWSMPVDEVLLSRR